MLILLWHCFCVLNHHYYLSMLVNVRFLWHYWQYCISFCSIALQALTVSYTVKTYDFASHRSENLLFYSYPHKQSLKGLYLNHQVVGWCVPRVWKFIEQLLQFRFYAPGSGGAYWFWSVHLSRCRGLWDRNYFEILV